MNASQLVAYLNALNVGDLDAVQAKLEEARRACEALHEEELARKLSEARAALSRADVRTFRKRTETVISKLGHKR